MQVGRRVLGLALAAVLVSVPTVAAEPTGYDPDPRYADEAYHGLAYPHTEDSAPAWFPDQNPSCLAVITTFHLTLVPHEGAPTNALELRAPTTPGANVWDVATPVKPATLVVQQPDACVDFTVSAVAVNGTQPYTVYVSRLPS